jgi:hypothetical protein
MGQPQTNTKLFCSECGDFFDKLDELTGWCEKCSIAAGYLAPSCPICHEPTINGKPCSKCRYAAWLLRNGDAIDRAIAEHGLSPRNAKKIVEAANRPICKSCGKPIKGGQKGRHNFCMKNPECVKAHNAYTYHIKTKPPEEALALAITASVIYKLTANISTFKLKPQIID